MLDRIGRGPQPVTRSRLFEYLLYWCQQTEHRQHDLAPDADVNMMEDQELAYPEQLEQEDSIQRELQWCLQRRLIVEVRTSGSITAHLLYTVLHITQVERSYCETTLTYYRLYLTVVLASRGCLSSLKYSRVTVGARNTFLLCAGAEGRQHSVPHVVTRVSCNCVVSAPAESRRARSRG